MDGKKRKQMEDGLDSKPVAENKDTLALRLIICFIGLQVSYLTWGLMQETVVTTNYGPTPRVPSGKFPSATFLVFANRFLAIFVAAMLCYNRHGTLSSGAPFWYFSPCSMSNVLSSYGQYAALKYVSFPLQVLFKSTKLIPVMLMGTFLHGGKYTPRDYLEAMAIAAGVAIFTFSKSSGGKEVETEPIGILLLVMYVTCDAFTNQWQKRINKEYSKSVDSYQMMFAVNSFSIMFTVSYLLLSGEMWIALEFITYHPKCLAHIFINSVTSATGQLFIFYTILKFGPVVLTIIMNTRQMISMIISCIIFQHPVSLGSYCGASIVFGVISYGSYQKYKAAPR
uniref:Sugar phosphate transporter domain-containing protein n=1 Tax=Octactis speculum TaxID=3111310 RepID=A0A7S2HMN6_9STRA|mmetsp:Transcript_7548/g.9391  ORF Transcript_7548/g.9391 Transcript_7548/m.9391 type:complete len:339 (+) Transcript_7548:95-1111(+)